MVNGLSTKKIAISVVALLLAGVIGYTLRGTSMVKSTATTKTSPNSTTVKTSTQSTSSVSTNESSNSTANASDYKYAYLKNNCVNGLQSYASSVRAKAEAMAAKVRTQAAANADRSTYQAQIDELLAYVKTMQANMSKLQNCITKVDQRHDFSAGELAEIDAAIAASTK
jgi:hypothetical protein